MLIEIDTLKVPFCLGCTKEEQAFPQIIEFDIAIRLNDSTSLQSDNLADTVDYMEVIGLMEKLGKGEPIALLEHLVSKSGKAILELSSKIDSVNIRATKQISPLTEGISFSAEISR